MKEEDPIKNPRPASLLNGSDSTVKDMLMGVAVAAPLPGYPDDGIPPYKIHNAMYIEIFELFPSGKPSSLAQSWLPSSKKMTWDQVDQVKQAWEGKSLATKSQKTVEAWSKAFQWTDKAVGDAPAYLLNKFEKIYLEIPSLTGDA